jgi:acyl-CoA thioesterase FadM
VDKLYTALVTVRHHELDCFGRVHPSTYLRVLAQTAVEASTAAGYDAEWYAAAGKPLARAALDVRLKPPRARRGAARDPHVGGGLPPGALTSALRDPRAGETRLTARTDWVYVDVASGRPRRIPAEMEAALGPDGVTASEREPWQSPPPPANPARSTHRVRVSDLDGLAHVNNAAYLDVFVQAVFDALEDVGWSLDACVGSGAIPVLAGADLEYLESARYRDQLDIDTWFTPSGDGLDAHQMILRDESTRPLVRAATRWRWMRGPSDERADAPPALLAALRPLLAAA